MALGAVWIGNSAAEQTADVGAVLNVAQDLDSTRGWSDGLETMHVGLVDGPGNEPLAYCAAVFALDALLHRHNTLVCCHTGSRALAVALMYLATLSGYGWDGQLRLLLERSECDLPAIDDVHREAYTRIAPILTRSLT